MSERRFRKDVSPLCETKSVALVERRLVDDL